jgi:hypothetical protein
MPAYGIPRRSFTPKVRESAPFNWRRGLLRIWLLVSAGWVMSWAIYLIMYVLEGRFIRSDFLAVPIILFGPSVALLLFGIAARWAFRGFQVIERSVTRSPKAA